MQTVRPKSQASEVISAGLAAGFALGFIGWVWDDLEHQRILQLGVAWAHLLMTFGLFVALAGMVVALGRSVGRLPAYLAFLAGFGLSFVHPLAGRAVWLGLALGVAWLAVRAGSRGFGLAGLGLAVVIIGGIVDVFWHRANPGVVETNLLLLPGHAVELAGWGLGLAGSVLAWQRSGGSSEEDRQITSWVPGQNE